MIDALTNYEVRTFPYLGNEPPLESFFESVTSAIRYVRYSQGIRVILFRNALFSLFIAVVPALMPVVGLKELHLAPHISVCCTPAWASARCLLLSSFFRGHAHISRADFAPFDFTPFQAIVYLHQCLLFFCSRPPPIQNTPRCHHRSTAPSFTPKQEPYLAFIYAYTHVLGQPPAEADLQRHFGVSPHSVHQMVLTLERAGLIRRQPGVARSIEVLIAPELLPILR